MGRLRLGTAAALVLAGLAAAGPVHAGSLYSGPGPRPGPAILYAKPATAPQLENSSAWRAPPILISGASAYRRGEFLYQDYLFDDHGANGGQRDQNDPRSSGDTFAAPNGTYTYPTNPVYANNAADLVELRVKPLQDATAFRVTLNTMKDPSAIVVSGIKEGEIVSLTLAPAELVTMAVLLVTGAGSGSLDARLRRRLVP
ncbi:MAG: hypothetical protein E6G07_02565 [Actinobacteria bacterium]|nr:MAG: hypothetical protein E6G07_02565 [Actinomycetota bacterium]